MNDFCEKLSELMAILGMEAPVMNEADGWPKAMKFLEFVERNIEHFKNLNSEEKKIASTLTWLKELHRFANGRNVTKIEIAGLALELK